MQVLPSGLAVPPLPYVAVLVVFTVALVALLVALEPPVTQRQVVAFVPWIATGGILHAFHQLGVYPSSVAPFFGAPAVYVTTFVLTGAIWLVSAFLATVNDRPERIARDLVAIGSGVLVTLVGFAYWQAAGLVESTVPFAWPVVGVLGGLVITAPAYYLLTIWQTSAVAKVGYGGVAVVYAHALDGFSTALGVDVLGVGERTPIPARIMEFAADLPTAQYIGQGWLFVVVKLLLAMAIVLALDEYVDEEPTQGNLLLTFVAAVGLGPAANNLTLFLLGGSVVG